MKKVLIGVVLGLMIVVVGVTSYFIGTRSSASKAEKLIYFDEPEEAIMKFVESVNDADMPGIKEAFGIAVKTEGFDYGKYAEVLKSISPMAGMTMKDIKKTCRNDLNHLVQRILMIVHLFLNMIEMITCWESQFMNTMRAIL
jgi:hypothetical protein